MDNDTTPELHKRYAGHPGENYEKYFVPTIGEPAARRVVEAADLGPGERVVDLACGTGVAARMAAAEVGSPTSVTGVDPAPPMLEVARRMAPEIEWLHGAAESMPLDDGSADVVVCSQGYQFFADKAEALDEISRVLAPNGRVSLGTPGPTPPAMTAISEALRDHVGPEAAGFVEAVFSVHDPEVVRTQLSEAGFSDIAAKNEPMPLHVGPPAEFFWQYVHSTPLAPALGRLDEAQRELLEREVVERCQPYLEGGSVLLAPGMLVATARHN